MCPPPLALRHALFLLLKNNCIRYNGNANAALKMLNKAKKDPVLGQKALSLVTDIYVNPTGDVLRGDAIENGNIGDAMANGADGNKESLKDVALSIAETLIRVCIHAATAFITCSYVHNY